MIVVVDDERDVLEVVCSLLEDEGYSVMGLSHPIEAAVLHEAAPEPTLFLLDIMLPEMNGIALARLLQNNGFVTTPKIAMSASPHMLRVAKDSGLFQDTIGKPFDVDELLSCIGHYLAS
ncbi:MAG TPA: response regulator [Chloroflexota bacterium]